ncbi:MAG: diguanylate cyclase [Treponema sp.]|jgi:diguanylate cyclase (GGDEF)-like protein|nr:diguanylate cyclase [Treponema sp.]
MSDDSINRKYSILLVDDERTNLVLDRVLSAEYSTLMAHSGGEALKLALENVPDIILLDVLMPDISGFDVLVKLKDNPVTMKIPVIFITSLINDEDEERSFLLGAVDYIKKPCKDTIVKARVNTHLQIVHQMRLNERLGTIDPLTDLHNRRSFNERIDLEWKRAMRDKKPISFLMTDVDNFKTYNDTYGHPQGDTLLKAVAKILSSSAKRPADMVARLGGEEFGILLPDTDEDAVLTIAENIRKNVEAAQIPTANGKTITSVTISIGAVSTVPVASDAAGVDKFIVKADEYLYEAKKAGRNRVYFKKST